VHTEEPPPDSLDQHVRLCIDSIDVILVTLGGCLLAHTGLLWSPERMVLELALSEEDYKWLKHSIEKLDMRVAKSMILFEE